VCPALLDPSKNLSVILKHVACVCVCLCSPFCHLLNQQQPRCPCRSSTPRRSRALARSVSHHLLRLYARHSWSVCRDHAFSRMLILSWNATCPASPFQMCTGQRMDNSSNQIIGMLYFDHGFYCCLNLKIKFR